MRNFVSSQEKEASLIRSLEAANLAALQATRHALPQLPHPLAFRTLFNGVMSGASAVRENLVENVLARSQRQAPDQASTEASPSILIVFVAISHHHQSLAFQALFFGVMSCPGVGRHISTGQ
jgi:hypothetical protein